MRYLLRKTLIVKCLLDIPKKFILEKSELFGIYDIFAQCDLRWASNLTREILYFKSREGSRKAGKSDIKKSSDIKRLIKEIWESWKSLLQQNLSKNQKKKKRVKTIRWRGCWDNCLKSYNCLKKTSALNNTKRVDQNSCIQKKPGSHEHPFRKLKMPVQKLKKKTQ